MRYLEICLLILLLFSSLGSFSVRQHNQRLVGVYFYPWYSITQNRHWDKTVIDRPVIGYYDSYNETVIKWQLQLIKDSGIDFVIFSWWGPNSFEDNTTRIVVERLRDYNLKFAIMIEPYINYTDPTPYNRVFWNNVLSYLRDKYIDKYQDIYMKLRGKPLVLAFNPIGMKYNPSRDFSDYTIRITGNDIDNAKYQDWDYWPDYIDLDNITLKIRRDNVFSIIPRFDDTHFRSPGRAVDQDYTLGLYGKEWDWILKHKEEINMVLITSWNEYHERTMIEPHIDKTANIDPYYIYRLTKELVIKFKDINYTSNVPNHYYLLENYILICAVAFLIIGIIVRLVYKAIKRS